MNTQTNSLKKILSESNDTVNQDIKSKFVQREILACASYLMDELFKAGNEVSSKVADLPQYEDIENLYEYPEWSETVVGEDLYFPGGTEEAKRTFLEEFDRLIEESEEMLESEEISESTHERNVSQIEDKRREFEDIENEPQEIFEWWIVSDHLHEKLKEQNEPVLEYANLHFWGRCTTGQAILLDGVISRICAEMEILKGQKYDWSKIN